MYVQCVVGGAGCKLNLGVGGVHCVFACVDENDGGCQTEEYILCAFDQIANVKDQIHYLARMGECRAVFAMVVCWAARVARLI